MDVHGEDALSVPSAGKVGVLSAFETSLSINQFFFIQN
jgi:hypothetical protein